MAEENGGWSRSLSAMENESSNHHCPYSGCGALRTFRNVCAFFLCMAVSPLSFLIFVRKPDFPNDVDEAFAASVPTGFLQENLIGPNQLPGHLFHAFCFVPGNLLYPDYKTQKDKNALQIVYIPCRFFPGNHRRQKLRQKTGSSASVFSQMAWFYAHFSGPDRRKKLTARFHRQLHYVLLSNQDVRYTSGPHGMFCPDHSDPV